MTGHRELRRTARTFRTQSGKPRRAIANDRRHAGKTLRVVDRRRLAVQTEVGRERRLEARLALLAFQRLEQRRFFAADIGACADESVKIEIDARALNVLAEQPAS